MRFTALIAATMALAGSAAAQCPAGATANCKPGFNYCASTLNKLGSPLTSRLPVRVSVMKANHIIYSFGR